MLFPANLLPCTEKGYVKESYYESERAEESKHHVHNVQHTIPVTDY